MGVGNLPAVGIKYEMTYIVERGERDTPLERPGPRRRGICLIKVSEAKKASYFFASFFTSFLFLLSLKPHESIYPKQKTKQKTTLA
jgi:hypothetical protein